MSIVNINGVDLELDLMDADVLENFETSVEDTSNSIGNMEKFAGMKGSEAIRKMCDRIDEFFDDLFGEGTAEAIFKGKSNIKEHIDAFGKICTQAEGMEAEIRSVQEQYNFGKKYNANREQRRYAQFHGQKGNNGKS